MSPWRFDAFPAVEGDPRLTALLALRPRAEDAPDSIVPGTQCLVLFRQETLMARASLGLASDLVGAPGITGMVGHYEALDLYAGAALLREACRRLVSRGADRVIGPMNGSTWMRYRLALAARPEDPRFAPHCFAGEPRNPFDYPDAFEAAGFRVASRYESRIEDLPFASVNGDADANPRGVDSGVRLRGIDRTQFDREFEAIHRASLSAFSDNLYYSPVSLPTFRALYEPLRTHLDPAFVLLAEDEAGELLGYQFAYPDPLSLADGHPTRLIIKTLGVVPEARGRRVGSLLMDRARELARNRGIPQVIYALMRTGNVAGGMSQRRVAQIFRRYVLFEWRP